ncbi:MAG: acylphosphatase [Acidobacteria bacterium]|nr:acylphosphatase [Acidobacteriota bacterium]
MKTARLYIVEGRVQGVGFRFFVERVAQSLGLTGYVRNRPDGRVEVYAIGEEHLLEQLKGQLEVGPPASRVEKVQEQVAPLKKDYKSFSISW